MLSLSLSSSFLHRHTSHQFTPSNPYHHPYLYHHQHVRTGTCVILGDRNNTGLPFPIKLGDCFRLGSVGLVVSELRTADGEEQRLDSRMLQVSEVCIYYVILNVCID